MSKKHKFATMQHFKKNLKAKYQVAFTCLQTLDHFVGRKVGFKMTKKIRKRLYEGLHADLLKKGEKGKVIDVDRVSNISEEEFRRTYLKRNVPVILEGAALDWPCLKEWDIDYFIKKHGDDEILVVGEIELNEDGTIRRENYETNLSNELMKIKNGGKNYYKFYPLIERHPEHLNDIKVDFLKRRINRLSMLFNYQVFIGAKNTITNLHNASASNLFIQVLGEKEWCLYPVYYSCIIDPSPTDGLSRGAPVRTQKGPFNPFHPDYKYPYHLFEFIDSYSVKLKPGDILFNPPYWWHAVRNNSTSIGMGFRWYAPWAIWKSSKLYFMLDAMSSFWFKVGSAKRDINKVHRKNFK